MCHAARSPGILPCFRVLKCVALFFYVMYCAQVTRYLEFKTVDGSYVVKGSKVNKVTYEDGEGCWHGLAWLGSALLSLAGLGLIFMFMLMFMLLMRVIL